MPDFCTSVTVSPQDPQYIQQALTHVLLMDAVVGTVQAPGAIYAASKLSYFDKMKNESKKHRQWFLSGGRFLTHIPHSLDFSFYTFQCMLDVRSLSLSSPP